MKPKTFIAFYIRGLINGEPLEAVGDRSVLIVDGRKRIDASLAEYARTECAQRGYIGFTICRGTFSHFAVLRKLELLTACGS